MAFGYGPAMRGQRSRSSLHVLLAAATLAAFSCTSDEGPYGVVEDWQCFETLNAGEGGSGGAEQAGACDCYGIVGDQAVSDQRPAVRSCSDWLCCYAWERDDGGYDCRCEDAPPGTQVAAYCAIAAAEHEGDVVEACPPTPRDNPTYCAFQGESCAPEYLDEFRLTGCCDGSECKEDSRGNLICQAE